MTAIVEALLERLVKDVEKTTLLDTHAPVVESIVLLRISFPTRRRGDVFQTSR